MGGAHRGGTIPDVSGDRRRLVSGAEHAAASGSSFRRASTLRFVENGSARRVEVLQPPQPKRGLTRPPLQAKPGWGGALRQVESGISRKSKRD